MRVPKKFLILLFMAAALIFISGCGSDKDDNAKSEPPAPQRTTTQPAENPPPVSKPKAVLYHSDFAITADQFAALYNAALDELAKQNGTDFNNRKLTFDNPKNVERLKGGTINLYSGKFCTVSLNRNNSSAQNICGVSLIAKAGHTIADCLPEVAAGIFAATQSGQDFSTVYNFAVNAVKARQPFATVVDGLLIYHDADKSLMIFVDDCTAGDGFGERIVDKIKDAAKKRGWWLE